MKVRIDPNGRTELPATLREQLGLKPGDTVEINEHNGEWAIKAVLENAPPRWAGNVLVYNGTVSENLETAIEQERDERLRQTFDI